MNWMLPAQQWGRRVQGPLCANGGCASSAWERWRSRRSGVLLNGGWCCSEDCLRVAIQPMMARPAALAGAQGSSPYRLPLGLLIFSRGFIDQEDLTAALHLQSKAPELRIGECLCKLGLVNETDVTRALGIQNGVPVLLGLHPGTEYLVPWRLLQAAEAYCFRAASPELVYAGFSNRVDPSLVRAIESIMGASVEPCIIPSRLMQDRLASLAETHSSADIAFETKMLVSEMVDSICSYAKQVRADCIRIAHTSQYVWARIRGTSEHDVLFRVTAEH